MDLAWLSLLALVAVVAVSCTTRVNPGVVAIVLAWAIVALAGPWFQSPLGLKSLWSAFPGELFLTLLGVSLLFSQAEANGTLVRVADAAQQLCGGNIGLLPIMFFVLALGLGTAGPGNIAVAGVLAPAAMAAAHRAGIPPLVMALLVGHGAIACTLSPLTAAGVVADQILLDMGLGGREWQVYAANAAANATAAGAAYVLLGGWRFLRKGRPLAAPSGGGLAQSARSSFDSRHWITLTTIAAVIVAVVAGRVHVGPAAFAGAAIVSLLRLADERQSFAKVPWGVIVMVCGVSVLSALLHETGGTARFANLIGRVSTPRTASGVLALATGLVSIYSSTTGVVLPAFLPMVKTLAASQPGSDPFMLSLAVLIGGNLVDMSPLSTIGALCVAAAPEGVDRRVLGNQLLAWGFALALLAAVGFWIWSGVSG
jgi:di/tricarboxylate transporter